MSLAGQSDSTRADPVVLIMWFWGGMGVALAKFYCIFVENVFGFVFIRITSVVCPDLV